MSGLDVPEVRQVRWSVSDWTPTDRERPPAGEVVEAMDSGGHVQRLVFDRNLWWFPDRSMYVYFTPNYWRRVPREPK